MLLPDDPANLTVKSQQSVARSQREGRRRIGSTCLRIAATEQQQTVRQDRMP